MPLTSAQAQDALGAAQAVWETQPYEVETSWWTKATAILRRGNEAFSELGGIVSTGAQISEDIADARLSQWDVIDSMRDDEQQRELQVVTTERGDNRLWPYALIGGVALVLIVSA